MDRGRRHIRADGQLLQGQVALRPQLADLRSDRSDDLVQKLGSLSHCSDDPAEAAEFHDQLRHVCATLDATERRVIEMRLEGYSIAEVARSMGIEPHLLRVRMSRLRARLLETGVLTEWL